MIKRFAYPCTRRRRFSVWRSAFDSGVWLRHALPTYLLIANDWLGLALAALTRLL